MYYCAITIIHWISNVTVVALGGLITFTVEGLSSKVQVAGVLFKDVTGGSMTPRNNVRHLTSVKHPMVLLHLF